MRADSQIAPTTTFILDIFTLWFWLLKMLLTTMALSTDIDMIDQMTDMPDMMETKPYTCN